MKIFWRYRCDFGHSWILYRDSSAAEQEEDTFCPLGHEAVHLWKQEPTDIVHISFRPATRVVDDVTGQVGHQKRYFLVITDAINEIERMSKLEYVWEEVKKLSDNFQGLSSALAWKMFDKLNL